MFITREVGNPGVAAQSEEMGAAPLKVNASDESLLDRYR